MLTFWIDTFLDRHIQNFDISSIEHFIPLISQQLCTSSLQFAAVINLQLHVQPNDRSELSIQYCLAIHLMMMVLVIKSLC